MSRLVYICLMLLLVGVGCNKSTTSIEDVVYVRNDGADMPAFLHGNGKSKTFIVVLHGGPGGNGLEYRFGDYYKVLEEKYVMVYWDQRGQGASHGHYGTDVVNIAQMVEDTKHLLLILKHKYGQDISLFLMGHSWGGTLGTAFMVTDDNQQLLKGWIEADGAHDIPLLNKEAVKMFINIGEDQINQGKNLKTWQKFVDFAYGVDTNNISTDDGDLINEYGFEAEEILDEIFESEGFYRGFNDIFGSPVNAITSFAAGNTTSNLLYNEVEATSLTDQLHKITIPCLFLWGKYDFVVPAALGYDAYNKVSSTEKELVLFEHSGHSPMDNEPELFSAAIIAFVDKYK